MGECGLRLGGSGEGKMAGSCKNYYKILGSIKFGEFIG
jgi:hypothetical protein